MASTDIFGNSYYVYVPVVPGDDGYSYDEALAASAAAGGHLLTIETPDEQAFINTLLVKYDIGGAIWHGIDDSETEGLWKYTTGPLAGQVVSYFNWEPGSPNNAQPGEDFGMIYGSGPYSGRWGDYPANDLFYQDGYIIEFDLPPGVTITGTKRDDLIDSSHSPKGQSLPTEWNDSISGLAGDDAISGLGGNDQLFGNAGCDILRGDSGNDHIDGGIGEDILDGGTGDDSMSGGQGSDVFDFTGAFGNDTIWDFDPRKKGDFLDISDFGIRGRDFWSHVAIEDDAGDAVITIDDGGTIRLVDTQIAKIGIDDFILT